MSNIKFFPSFWRKMFPLTMIALTSLPSGLFFLKHKRDMTRWAQVNEEVLQLKTASDKRILVQKNNARFVSTAVPEPTEVFCQRVSEETNFLEKERASLKAFINNESRFASPEEVEYYQFLTTQNRVLFLQKRQENASSTEISFRSPIQCNEKDVENLLLKLDASINNAALEPSFLKKWEMQKKKTPLGNEVWLVQATIIKREVSDVH
ncbi:hypothetical protein [Chlamydiifrater phoenicopteri]|uniref:hypothetical protein n=1 Tax=Chlamydiifrater phoenicopteri TaxID=2681469 RepID=UPI001BCA91CF|nr:hypothetical protein [Chlamydiifrater phoenicopteri]